MFCMGNRDLGLYLICGAVSCSCGIKHILYIRSEPTSDITARKLEKNSDDE
jgi:hypothetical protein